MNFLLAVGISILAGCLVAAITYIVARRTLFVIIVKHAGILAFLVAFGLNMFEYFGFSTWASIVFPVIVLLSGFFTVRMAIARLLEIR